MDDLLSEFLTETSEALAVLDVELVKFEQDPSDSEILGNIFRLVHTIKGTCGFLGLPRLESVAHAGENVLGNFRDGVVDVTPEAVTLILKCLDTIRELLGELEESGEEPEGEDSALIAELNAMADGESAPAAAAPAEAEAAPEAAPAPEGAASEPLADSGLVLPTADEIKLVQDTFKLAEPNAAGIAEMFYNRLFEIKPDFKDLFKGDMKKQGEHLMEMLKTVVEGLDDLDSITFAVQDLGRRHVDYGVKDEDYDSVGEALLWTLGKGFGDDFTDDVKSAWTTVYTLLASMMINAVNEAGDQAPAEDAAPPTNDFGAPVAQDLLDEVMAAEAEGVKAATQAPLDTEITAERETEKTPESKSNESKPAEANAEAKEEVMDESNVPTKIEENAPVEKEESKAPKESSVAQSSIRVHVDVLEDLMTQVSELVLTRNALLQLVRDRDQDDELTTPLQRLSHITSDLQEGVMKTRMQPIGNAWAKLPRIVRDLSVESGKQIELEMLGADTELDRQVLELIKDPLTHMVRNSADHGLELPAERVEAGKPEKGLIKLNAFHQGGHIIIEISDDGKGLDMDRIREKCIENGVATETELEGMTDQQVQQFIFAAGFSTAEKVTSISGRGVGMDVVRTNIEKINGTIELKSVAGKGSTFTIKIPLTLAIVSALIVECSKERFAIPQISVLELVRASSHSENAVEMINESPVLRLRNRLLPLVSLENLLEFDDDDKQTADEIEKAAEAAAEKALAAKAAAEKAASIKASADKAQMDKAESERAEAEKAANEKAEAAEAAAEKAAGEDATEEDQAQAQKAEAEKAEADKELAEKVKAAKAVADEVAADKAKAHKEAAAKSLLALDELSDDEMFIVVTQVGTNTFGIIVDQVFDTEEIVVKPVSPILRDISFYSGNTILGDGSVIMILDPNGIASAAGQLGTEEEQEETTAQAVGQEGEIMSLLIFRAGGKDRKAVPLALIARLEEINMADTETSHGQVMVQYRDHLMPLIPCDPGHEFKTEGRQPILVFTDSDRSLGLAVDEIVDIVEDRLKIELASDAPGLIGSAVIDGKATDLIDAGYYLTQGFPDWFGTASQGAFKNKDGTRRALLVDDSPFFRNLLSPLLSVAGWEVITAETADEALKMRELGNTFDVIISDIEMPGMDGFEFAADVRGDPRWKDIPMVALSGHSTDDDFQKGREAGFNDYVAKYDREALVSGLAQTVAGAAMKEASAPVAEAAE